MIDLNKIERASRQVPCENEPPKCPLKRFRFPHEGAAIFLFVLTLFIGFSAQVCYLVYDGRGGRFVAEFAAYALPAFAAIAAAMTVFEKHVKALFWFASICVVLGLLSYIYAQGNLRAVGTSAVMVLGAFLTACIIPYSNYMDRVKGKESAFRHGIVGICFLIFVVAELIIWPKIFASPKGAIPSIQLRCAISKPDESGQSVLTCTHDD